MLKFRLAFKGLRKVAVIGIVNYYRYNYVYLFFEYIYLYFKIII